MPDAFVLFLTVGLPARGLEGLGVVPFVVLVLAMTAAVAGSLRHRTLLTLAGPVVALAVASVLVEPVGFAWWVPIAVAGAGGVVLVADARTDVSQLPPLVGTNTEARRQLVWWRPIAQVVPALLAVMGLAAILPRGETVDVRRHVSPATERIADVNPLAVAARAPQLAADEGDPVAVVRTVGPQPGRLRLAVLDRYTGTGWSQSADFSVTGETLAEDPVVAATTTGPDGADLAPARTTVEVERPAGPGPFAALATATSPSSVGDPDGIRFSARAGVLLSDDPSRVVRYEATVPVAPSTNEPDVSVGRFPPVLATCPASAVVRSIADQLVAGATTTDDRLARIENFLKLRRIYDPAAPGGQTLRGVERFLEQDFARGNLEVFVTSYALLARCAGVPVRVVVGLPAPAASETTYRRHDVTAWVETPLVRAGWSARDPLPTPDEQRQQAQLARQPAPPEPKEPEPEVTPPLRRVAPRPLGDGDRGLGPLLSVAALLALVGAVGAWTLALPRWVVARRRRTRDAAQAVPAAWSTVADALVDRDLGLHAHHTPDDVVGLVAGRVPATVPRLVRGMAPLVNAARYAGTPPTDEDAALAWAHADAILERLPVSRTARLTPLRHPARALDRARAARRIPTRRAPWRGELPASAALSSREAPSDIPDVTIDARIGEGSTGTVYRGVWAPTAGHVAIKVFRYGPGDAGFDPPRFDWEVRIARHVSGLPHLPIVHAAGITPVTNRPYLVSSLCEDGTLLDRVRRGGPMSQGEVVAIGSDVATALICLHQLGVVHGDVKPENVFAGADGWILGDLGSAWLRASRGPAASLTPPYAAPEVWRGASPSPPADLYSLALTMLFAVTGQVPVASVAPTREDVLEAFPDHPVLARALDPDARRRPRSVADFLRSLRPDLAISPGAAALRGLSLPTPTVSHGR